jgi:serine/threonine protein phosphatase PrpC
MINTFWDAFSLGICFGNAGIDEHGKITSYFPSLTLFDLEVKAPDISIPSLNTNNLNLLPASLHTDELLAIQLGSQGFFKSCDNSYAYNHESSVCSSYYQYTEQIPYVVNMDRGGVVRRPDGSHAACIADGVGGDGYHAAFVAQMICEHFLNTFSHKSMGFTEDPILNKKIAAEVFQACADQVSKLSPNTLIGGSTALFVECVPAGQRDEKNRYLIQVAALGDGAIIHINSEENKILQLNTIHRYNNDRYDCGGCVSSWGFIKNQENIVASSVEASEDDYILLVTDGFLDNVRDDKVLEVVELVAFHPFFDQPFEKLVNYNRFWEDKSSPQLPTIEDIKKFILDNDVEKVSTVQKPTSEQITKRLANYTKLVTYLAYRLEDATYTRRLSEPQVVSKPQVATTSTTNAHDHDPKTDDYMIITMTPGSKFS